MIISASRRTDIPSYYGKWFFNRLQAGYMLVQNPYNALRLSKIPLSPDTADCIVFWTKNPAPMLEELKGISDLGFHYYFQYTLTPYGEAWEKNLPSVEKRIDTLCLLSDRIGKHRLVWRYDPIILDDIYSVSYHIEQFGFLCEKIHSYTDECIISFVDSYSHMHNAMPEISREQMKTIAKAFSEIAAKYRLKLAACCEKIDLREFGITRASCIDKKRIEQILGGLLNLKKDAGQRLGCGCMESVDIGVYQTCLNGCKYCYATKNPWKAQNYFKQHDPESPMLIGWPGDDIIVTEKNIYSSKITQTSFL